MEEFSIVGKPMPRVDGLDKATGRAVYSPDMELPHMLHGKILTSTYPHARILNIDVSKAERLTGVKAVITARDTPDVAWGFMIKDQPLLARDKVRYIGEPLAVVAASGKDVAEEALDLIEVEYEELKATFDPEEAMKPDAPLIHEGLEAYTTFWPSIRYGNVCSHVKISRGDVEKGFKEAFRIFEDRFTTQMQHQCYLETHASLATVDLGGKVTVWTSSQAPFSIRSELAETLRIPLNKIRVIATQTGGGFGGKTDISVEPYCVLLAQKTNRPVKITLSRKEEFTISGPRHASIIELKTGVKRDGTIISRQAKLIYDTGGYAGPGPGVASLGSTYAVGPYRIPNIKVDAYCVYTNKTNCGWMRCPGVVQTNFASESQMDIIAKDLGKDPLDLRLRNAVEDGDLSPTGQVLHNVGLKASLQKAAQQSGWGKKTKEKNRGKGISCVQYESLGMASSALVKVNEDGTINLVIGAVDIGQGSSTILAQMVAEELGVPFEEISVSTVDTEITPFDTGTIGDRVTYNMGNAVRMAAADCRQQLLYLASSMLEANPADLKISDKLIHAKGVPEKGVPISEVSMAGHYFKGGPITGRGVFFAEPPAYDQKGVEGHAFPSAPIHTFAAQVAEVEVNPKNGKVRILRIISAHDLGFAINPMLAEGQIEGAVAMGIGYAMTERLVEDKGNIVNPNFSDYKIPNILDVPKIEVFLVGEKAKDGPFGAKGLGNPGVALPAPAIANAIEDAVGIRIKDLPITPEKVFFAKISPDERGR